MSLSHNSGLSGEGAMGVCCLDAAARRDLRISSLGHMTEFFDDLPMYGICAISRVLLVSDDMVGCVCWCSILDLGKTTAIIPDLKMQQLESQWREGNIEVAQGSEGSEGVVDTCKQARPRRPRCLGRETRYFEK